jgi:hypothetical protein
MTMAATRGRSAMANFMMELDNDLQADADGDGEEI